MYLLRNSPNYISLKTCVRLYSFGKKSHYDVLKLRKNCSDKQIKEAFIQMSKEYHPDKNKDVKAQEKFIQIVEAYNVLGKPGSRARYDSITEISTAPYVYKTNDVSNNRTYPNYNYYYESMRNDTNRNARKKGDGGANDSYYGFAGVKKVPNYYIICICLGIAVFGVIVQVYIMRNMYTIQRSKALEKSKNLAEELDRVRAAAIDNGNELQTRLIMEKIVGAANSTVSTASLGQALANEKK